MEHTKTISVAKELEKVGEFGRVPKFSESGNTCYLEGNARAN
jgi:hypothetical protein